MGILIMSVEQGSPFGLGDIENPQANAARYDFWAEETSDMTDLPTQFTSPYVAAGSKCHDIEANKDYYLPSTGVWSEQGNKPTAESLSSIDITAEPTVKKYYYGDALNTAGFAAKAVYNSKREDPLTAEDVTFSVNSGTTASLVVADTTVTATYSGETDTYGITVVKKLKSIATSGMTTSYDVGDNLSIDNLVVTASYDGGSNAAVSAEDYTIDYGELSAGKKLVAGDNGKKITISYTREETGLAPITKTVQVTISVTAAG